MVYGTIQQHKGEIIVSSEYGVGTSFLLNLPVATKQPATSVERQPQQLGSGYILVVDDEEVVRTTTSEILKGHGYQVMTAHDGKHALELFKKHGKEFDLVLLDIGMPIMNGRDCFLALREIEPDVKVVLSSGYSGDNDIEQLLKNGAKGFLQKPFSSSELSSLVHRLLA